MVSATNNIPLITTATLQYRLDTQNFGKSGGQRGSLTRCAQKYGSFRVTQSSDTTDAEVIERSKDDLVREVELFDLEMTKLIAWQRNLERQAKHNEMAQIERKREIQAARQQVCESRERAEKSLERRNCLLEYEALAKIIHENHPITSVELQEEIDKIRSELSTLDEEIASKDGTLKVREAQYQTLIQYMSDLKQTLKEEEEHVNGDAGSEKAKENSHNDIPQPMETDDLYGDL